MWEVSKALKPGDPVAKRGNKLVRCGKKMRPIGVWGPGFIRNMSIGGAGGKTSTRVEEKANA